MIDGPKKKKPWRVWYEYPDNGKNKIFFEKKIKILKVKK